MKKSLLAILLVALLVLSGCTTPPITVPDNTEPPTIPSSAPTSEPTSEPTAAPTEPATKPTEEATEPIASEIMYKHAVANYLPIEDYSWERRYTPEFVMIHFTSAVVNHRDDPYNIGYIRDIYVDYDISIHYVIQRDGTIYCFMPENRVTWHAGPGTYLDDPKYTDNMNHYSIGIELLAIGSQEDMALYLTPDEYEALDDSLKGYTEAQYDALAALIADLCQRYEIPHDSTHIIGHGAYSPDKPDPGELFDWTRILNEAD